MKKLLLAGVAAFAVGASAHADGHINLTFPIGDGEFNWASYEEFAAANDFAGEAIEITGPWTGQDAELVNSMLDYFEQATGATVNYSGSDSFENDIVIAARAGSAPNLAVFPQPGLAADMAAQGFLTPLAEGSDAWMRENYAAGQSWVDLGSFADRDGNDQYFGFFYKVDVKSIVWYSESAFDEAGYDIPETMEELKELTQQIVDDGGTPWCIGLGSGAATGWPATDWVEDMMLRTQAPETYDAWVANEISFNDPAVVGAIEEFGFFAKNDDFVQGGAQAVATTDFRESPNGLFAVPPECYMHRQASFIPTFFPEGNDSAFFYFPAYEGRDLGSPVLGAGTMWAITNPSDAASALLEFLKTPVAHEVWMAQSGFLTPHNGVNTDLYANDMLKGLGEILLGASTFRFDASDLMPGEIGAGAFWTGMVDYVTGEDAEAVATGIQQRWDGIQ
ncbi:MAG: ABC transporter substrate-binding protein [Pseudomonadota bacterium]